MKSLEKELFQKDPQGVKNLNKNEIKAFETFYKALRNDSDWIVFSKLLLLYFDGVMNLKTFAQEFEEEFEFIKPEIK